MSGDLLWSSMYIDNICENYMECDHCEEGCLSYDGNIAYDLLDDIIMDDLNMKFDNKQGYEYFIMGIDYTNYYGMYQNMDGYSKLYDTVEDIIFNCLSQGGAYEGFRIYKGKYNHIIIERSHHDGNEYYLLCRLNKQGQDYCDNGYDFDFRKYSIKSVFKDFDFFN